MGRRFALYPFVFFLLVFVVYAGLLLARSTGTALTVPVPVKVVGVSTPVQVTAANPHGLREFRAILVQGGNRYTVEEQQQPARRWSLFRSEVAPATYSFDVGTGKVQGLQDGKAQLVLEAVSNDLRARQDQLTFDIEVNTRPPGIAVDKAFHTMTLGGSHAVSFTASGYWTEAGVRVGPYRFHSHPFPGAGDPNRRICFFGYPWDTKKGEEPVAYVRNPTGAEANEVIDHTLKHVEFRTRKMELDDRFLNRVVNALDPGGTGDIATRFVKINSEMRKANNAKLLELRNQTDGGVLWQGAFVQQVNSAVEAKFCDIRRYFYQGKQIDEQVHLGFDLASLSKAPVLAANAGKVIFAAPLGIYGNAVVVDHGLGVQSLYAHMSDFAVKVGDSVTQREVLGKSGSTGLAGGDHLHFSMQVDGVMVNPLEWLDPLWIQNIMAVLRPDTEKGNLLPKHRK